jgi:ketosteroid isomerase-like protein
MARANVDLFTELNLAFNRLAAAPDSLDPVALQAVLEIMDPAVRFEPQQASLEGGYAGHEGVLQWFADLVESYESGVLDLVDISGVDDRVLALGTLSFTGRGSGIKTEAPVAIVASFRDGLITEFKDYGDNVPALEAMGITE